jgi:hypothetical protein
VQFDDASMVVAHQLPLEGRGLAAAYPRHFSPCGSCSTTFGRCAHCAGRERNFSPRVGALLAPSASAAVTGVGEAGRAAHVIDVEVRGDDVPYVLPAEAECFDLPRGGLVAVEPRAQQAPGRADAGAPASRARRVRRSQRTAARSELISLE